MMSRICLYYIVEPEKDRWFRGDHHIRPKIRRLLRGPTPPTGPGQVFANLCRGLDHLRVPYCVNLPFGDLEQGDRIGVLGLGLNCLNGYNHPFPIVAGISLMSHPSQWPTLCDDYPVVRYLQHSSWSNDLYKPYFGDRCALWPAGIDTHYWQPTHDKIPKDYDFLIYNKISWCREERRIELIDPIRHILHKRGLRSMEIRYGSYRPDMYRQALARCRAMIFLSESESQGIAYQEALASGVPVLAWDPGECRDPSRFQWGVPHIPASSVPFFDERCGMRFVHSGVFPEVLDHFMDHLHTHRFAPRDYILENLTLELSTRQFLHYLEEAHA
ncbi:MAG: glycosyltransferase [Magnetococcales bacterium]|nr:glycosyltransferase [Magnetococcales bacterium]MBF0321334.1 glycosyltransferase [Magnetococcales bacterium]